jgi:U32 family peptidase
LNNKTHQPPEILAPAGNKASFLAAIAARADAIYCGLNVFSARMEARNFSLEQLNVLTQLAHEKGTRVYVTLNGLIKTGDIDSLGKILDQLSCNVKPDALIVQDLALVGLVRQTGFEGEIHLSTLANVSFAAALPMVRGCFGLNRVVIPRELNIDEIKSMAQSCPPDLFLEVFVHGALCYGVSGRCYWSSFLGGKSGLRGRCVQPCRRIYEQRNQQSRLFSCQDLSLDVLAKVLLTIPQIGAWKIEGRKKGPHYVYYTVTAYRMLRDEGSNPDAKKEALGLLSFSLGRPGTHYFFLPQRPQQPVNAGIPAGSGFMIGRVKGTRQRPYLEPTEEILPGDILRLGYEDEGPHRVIKAKRGVPKKGRFDLQVHTGTELSRGVPVFLVDRREKALEKMLALLEAELEKYPVETMAPSTFTVRLPEGVRRKNTVSHLYGYRTFSSSRPVKGRMGCWVDAHVMDKVPPNKQGDIWWWLPPVVWPSEENDMKRTLGHLVKNGGKHFVLNAPYQVGLFEKPDRLDLWAGPFCNISNPLAVEAAARLGCSGVIVSPELGRDDVMDLPQHCAISLGIVVYANWPLTIGRSVCEAVAPDLAFTSPKGEQAWVHQYGQNYWVYPNWAFDMTGQVDILRKAGYSLFVHLHEPVPPGVLMKQRPGLWNWELGLA